MNAHAPFLRTVRSIALACAGLTTALSGCGAHTARYRFDDGLLANVGVDEKKPIYDAEQEVSTGKARLSGYKQELSRTHEAVTVAKLEVDRANLSVKAARVDEKLAKDVGDPGKLSQASDRLRIGELATKAAHAKLQMVEADRHLKKEQVEAADAEVAAALAHVEAEKARLAVAKGINPKGFDPSKYMDEYASRQRTLDRERRDVDEARLRLDEHTMKFREADMVYQQAAPAAAPAGMAPAQVVVPAPPPAASPAPAIPPPAL